MALSTHQTVLVRLLARHDQEIAALKEILSESKDQGVIQRATDWLAELHDRSLQLERSLKELPRRGVN
jgi:hypothetical protein